MSETYIGTGARRQGGYPFWLVCTVFALGCLIILLVGLSLGTVVTSLDQVFSALLLQADGFESFVIRQVRGPRMVAAFFAGGALAVSGLLMQTFFSNGLAGPHVLGINAGASFGAALVILGLPWAGNAYAELGTIAGATLGGSVVFVLLMVVAKRVRSAATILILGLIFGYAVGGLVAVMIQFTTPDRVQAFAVWQFGTFGDIGVRQLPYLILPIVVAMVCVVTMLRSLDALQIGEHYAMSLGIRVNAYRYGIIAVTALMSGVVTAYCGPIAFLGVATPHLVRPLLQAGNHRQLVPTVFLAGAALAMLADVVAGLPGSEYTLPLNAITAVIGAPVIAWVVLRK